MSKNNKLIFIGIVVFSFFVFIILVFLIPGKNDEKNITYSHASKMLALLDTDKNTIYSLNTENTGWSGKYINYMIMKGYFDKNIKADGYLRYGDLKNYFLMKMIEAEDVEKALEIKILAHKPNDKVTDKIFKSIYAYLVAKFGSDTGVHTDEIQIAMTNTTNKDIGKWQICTDDGNFGCEGLNLDEFIDSKIQVYVREKEIISFIVKVSDEIVYRNIFVENGTENSLIAYIGGYKREFRPAGITYSFPNVIADLHMKEGSLEKITLKNDSISGKVLMINNEKAEIEGYGVLEIDEDFHVYRTYGIIEEAETSDIMVGYKNTNFVIADKKICGAIISEPFQADNIRVMLMSTGFVSLFHKRACVKGTGDYLVKYGDITEKHKGEEIVDVYPGCEYLNYGRVEIIPCDENDKIVVLNVEKSYGNPKYRGSIEVAECEEGLVMINELPIEEYLYSVVPSEMPVRFGVEALKVQAVCARSYAYRQLINGTYKRYGAHVDDSVNFQVYNNVEEKDDSIQAVKETYGLVEAVNKNPITTYYFSTSCGHTSDISIWGGNENDASYLPSKEINKEGKDSDLSSEEAFYNYINNVNENDYDYGFGYYRWKVDMTLDDLSESINENLYGRYCASKNNILVRENDVYVSKEIRNIGKLEEIIINKRTKGGALYEIILKGSEATILVRNELNIRYLLCPRNNPITLLKGDTTTFYILPSAYCYFTRTENGYQISGGGYGHGIGMSQNAVSNMVRSGMNYKEILEFFYEGAELINVYE